jgi:hypothetical protein
MIRAVFHRVHVLHGVFSSARFPVDPNPTQGPNTPFFRARARAKAAGGPGPAVIASSVGSAAVLAAVIQTPGVSQFFGCTPLGPVGWGIAGTAAATATVTGPLVARLSRPG